MYVCILLNHLASAALNWIPSEQKLTGRTPDISKFLHLSFYKPVYYHAYTDTFPSGSNEEEGWWVGIATHVGDALTYKAQQGHKSLCDSVCVRSSQAKPASVSTWWGDFIQPPWR